MRDLRRSAGVLALAIALVASGCGQAADSTASLTVASVPKAEVFVDGISHGESGRTLTLSAGEHKLELRLEKFISHEETLTLAAGATAERDVTLAAQDPSDPTVIAKLAECEGVDVAPFVAPETTRGSRDNRAEAVLLWPSRDVRKDGLVSYAVEADETYAGDGTLEFRVGRKVLYREKFSPETITTIRALPAEVREEARVGRTLTWGLYYEDSRRPITTSFKIVQRPNAERQLERLRTSRHVTLQPEITQAILAATVLENNRLYSEALIANLRIAADHPESTQPYRGIITTLRRLDAEHSELYAFVAPHVSGKGGHAGIARPSATAGGMALGIEAWAPVQKGAVPTPVAVADATSGRSSSQGVTPTGGAGETPAQPGVASEPTTEPTSVAASQTARLEREIEALSGGVNAAKQAFDEAQAAADDADATAASAEEAAARTEASARQAREAVENATEPTREQQEEMVAAGVKAEEAREAALQAREAAEAKRATAATLLGKVSEVQAALDQRKAQLDRLVPTVPVEARPAATALPSTKEASEALSSAEKGAAAASAELDRARQMAEAAQAAVDGDPSPENLQALESAKDVLQNAMKADDAARESALAAHEVFRKVSEQTKDGVVK